MSQLEQDLQKWQSGVMTDCVIIVNEDKRYPLHRFPLSSFPRGSLFFQTLFSSSGFKENVTGEVDLRLPPKCLPAWEIALEYIYTGNLAYLYMENLVPVMKIAEQLMIPRLQTECLQFAKMNLGSENVFNCLVDCLALDQNELVQVVCDHIALHFSEIVNSTNTLPEAPEAIWESLLSSDDLNVNSEDEVYHFLVRLEEQENMPEETINKLWGWCRFIFLSEDTLVIASQKSSIPSRLLLPALTTSLAMLACELQIFDVV